MKDKDILDLYALSVLLVEKLDEFEGHSLNKQRLKFYSKKLSKELENFDKKVYKFGDSNEMNNAVNDLKERINKQ